ncbi:ATP-dependent transcriptional regulator [Longilinea arvoryzae]|uniref:ATP-dependent transcriptional regulator n=1 Tax=Longilinea arvoryzae TaxID=360412 RepID=A0A0S7BM02_9CHLR|nr:LuxR C-terminal-related transcriptional regulator [Longilinea arvoryzae]GAP15715.1 ATP-dependent transcriptional regulator [Longilinea arvoryzae]
MSFKSHSASQQPLLRTKISVPKIPPEFVHRPRLTERIDRGVLGPLTLLSAPAGFGKTNLLIEWAEHTRLPVAWLTLDSDDNDPNRFFRYFISALQTRQPGLGEETLDFILSTRGGGLEVGLTLLINEISALSNEIVLVLDDIQVLENPIILRTLDFYLKHSPYNLHLILASRCEPDLDLAFLRAKGRVIELNADDLRFSAAEVGLFFEGAMGLQLPPETIRMLEERTDGWITGLQMAAISLRHRADPNTLLANLQGDAHFLVDFLAEEVLDRQPEEIRQFLLRTSILDLLTGSLCEAVAMPEAQPGFGTVMLSRLEHANLFITALDEKREWFRYHPLFADFLRHIQAEINPAEISVLQKRASEWFERNGNLTEAIRFLLASKDLQGTADLIEGNIQSMVKTGDISSLTHWIGQLPKDIIRSRPGLSIVYAWGLMSAYRLDEARYWIDDLQQGLPLIENQAGPKNEERQATSGADDTGPWNFHGGLAICESFLAVLQGDTEKATEYSRLAANFLDAENPFIHSLFALEDSLYFILSGDTPKAIDALRDTIRIALQANNLLVSIIATCELADMQALQGHLTQAWATLQKVRYMAVDPDGKPLSLASLADTGFGEILLERGSLDEAQVFLESKGQTPQSLRWLSNLDGLISLAHLRQLQGNFSGAQDLITQASQLALGTESSEWDDILVSAVAVRLALQRADLPAAVQLWNRSGFSDFNQKIHLENYPYHVYEYLLLTQVRLLMAMGRNRRDKACLQQTLELMNSIQPDAECFQRVTSQIEILVLQAIAWDALGDQPRAVKNLLQALTLGEPEGYRRVFLDGGQPVANLLTSCRCVAIETGSLLPTAGYIDSLLAVFTNAARPAQTPPSSEIIPAPSSSTLEEPQTAFLSPRETEVLILVSEGKSNREISAQLYLALNTVKRHAYNIYAKLDVNNRTQAVSRARQLGLIP